MKGGLWIGASALICGISVAAQGQEPARVSGANALAVVHALQSAGARGTNTKDGAHFDFSEVTCSLDKSAKSAAMARAQCKLTSKEGWTTLTLLGLDAARVQLALEASGAQNGDDMIKRDIDVKDLSAELQIGSDLANVSFIDQNARAVPIANDAHDVENP